MRILILLSILSLASCSSTQMIKPNLYMASCDGMFGGCTSEMEAQCPNGYKVLAKKSEWHQQTLREHIHFECNDAVSFNN